MNAKTLDRLLIDRALGSLSEDVAALLTAYLEQHPEASRRGGEFEDAATAARQVLRQPSSATLPPFPTAAVQRSEQHRRRLTWARGVSGLAASLLAGVGLGSWLLAPSATPTSRHGPGDEPRGVAAVAVAMPAAQSADFWSTDSLVRRARRAGHEHPVAVVWHSSVMQPNLGESQ